MALAEHIGESLAIEQDVFHVQALWSVSSMRHYVGLQKGVGMSQSFADLRYRFKTNGEVRIPRLALREVLGQGSLIAVLIAAGIAIMWLFPMHWGRLAVGSTLLVSATITLVWTVRDWRKRLVITPEAVQYRGETPVPWTDVEWIGTSAARSLISVQLTPEGLSRYFRAEASSSEAGDRVVIWELSSPLNDDDIRFLRWRVADLS